LEKFNARLDEEIKKLMGPGFSGALDYEKGLTVKYNGIEEHDIDTPGVSKIVEMVARDLAEKMKFDLESYRE
ncbi:MAG: hypothetical protein HS052_04450, partial [Thaumarchaeota archaeon]|nr:hypothetical protein [Nitrososphaerota archaeon]